MSSQSLTTQRASLPLNEPVLGAATTVGAAGSLFMGVASWVLLLVERDLPTPLILVLSLVVFDVTVFLFLRNTKSKQALVGMLSGIIGGAISLVFLGSLVVIQSPTLAEHEGNANQFSGTGLLTVGAFWVAMAVVGWMCGALDARRNGAGVGSVGDSRSRFAWVCALSYLPLIAVGGLVTSTESGLAVPDSVTTYGSIGVLFPLSLMEESRIYFEHSHRIFGTFAGLVTIVLVIRAFGAPGGKLARVMSVVLLLAVIGQGVMGALRVSEISQGLASLHGILAQLVFAFAIATGVVFSRRWVSVSPSEEGVKAGKSARTALLVATVCLLIQLVFGAMTRHLDSSHAVMSHVGFSIVVVIAVIIAGAKCIKVGKADSGSSGIRPYGAMVHGLVVVQFVLGWGALGMTRSSEEHPELPTSTELASAHGIRVGEALMTTSHHVIGALLLATVVGALVWALRIGSRKV